MRFRNIIHKSTTFYTRYYKLVAIAVAITVSVITGSLVTGDSVRTTLVKRVTERLGDTQTIIFSHNSFMQEDLAGYTLLGKTRGILLTNGFISQNGKLVPLFVWGVNDMSVPKGSAKVNQSLANELGQTISDIVLRLPAAGLIPSGSLFVTENYTTSLRLSFNGVVNIEDGGNISMKNEQAIPLNIFVNREELAEAMDTKRKINLILSDRTVSGDELNEVWNYSLSGLSVNSKGDFTEIVSDRVFLQDTITNTICLNNPETANRLFSYLANSIELGNASIPYSFVTALDSYKNEALHNNEIILSDYSAKRLNAKTGDTIRLTYFTSHDLKTLKTDTVVLQVKKIVPIEELQEDNSLSAEFPGLSDVERCTDWDSDVPINMDLITDEDETYWEHYRSTPKAIIAYNAVARDWGNSYGNATAIRLCNTNPNLSGLSADMFGIQLIHPREAGIFAAKNGVDFSGLFLALGFFIIVSAILLMLIPVSEMLYQRRHEIALMKALGYTQKRISKMLWLESAPLVLVSSVVGVILGLVYTSAIMWLLGNVWKGATHTEDFAVYPNILTIAIGFTVGIVISLSLLRVAIAWNLKEKHQKIYKKKLSLKKLQTKTTLLSILAVAIIIVGAFYLHSVVFFVVAGIILMGMAALWGYFLVCRNGSLYYKNFNTKKLVWGTLYAGRKQAVMSFFTLSIGVFIVFSVGLNRKGFTDSSQLQAGTGGYSLWGESSVPVYHNMSTTEGRQKLSLTELPPNTEVLQFLRYGADDASCLNLNKVITPNVLGVDMETLAKSDFKITQNIYSTDSYEAFKLMQSENDSVYPALVDATVLTWSLGMKLGDTLYYTSGKGKNTAIILAGTLPNTIFQGNILIDRTLFSEIWEEITGSEVFLMKVNEQDKEDVKMLVSQALNEYGIRITTTNDRLKQFNTVTDTYLTIFMTLGGIGLLLGIMNFIIVIRKNLIMRRKEIDLYRTIGFTDDSIVQILYKENILVPLYAIAAGVICSLVGVSHSISNTSIWIWFMALLFTIFFGLCVIIFVKKSVQNIVKSNFL